ncbi:Predicted ATPase [Mobiluncus mulieris]|nr:Predicted ATPase [Mobiluncus mulieris]STY83251.1 Predicted ATPase [Mobiluncus mulieris]
MGVKLLRFKVRNFRSIREAQSIDFLRDTPPANQAPDWASLARPVTVFLGPNASGKSNVLLAMRYAFTVIARSFAWQQGDSLYKPLEVYPFSLDDHSLQEPSYFEFDFFQAGTRYVYAFEYGLSGVTSESLYYVPKRRLTPCFTRTNTGDGVEIEFNQSIGLSADDEKLLRRVASPQGLVLSAALRLRLPFLGKVGKALANEHFNFISLSDQHLDARFAWVAYMIMTNIADLDEIGVLMRIADTGITEARLDFKALDQAVLKKLEKRNIISTKQYDEGSSQFSISIGDADFEPDEAAEILQSFRFSHRGEHGSFELRTVDESYGTLTWLSVAPAILRALRQGSVLIADEIDASLHQNLLEFIIKSFSSSFSNPHGAQLIISSHNTNLLEHIKSLDLEPNSFWFTEKRYHGETQVYTLDDFEKHPNANYERRYLSGKYGALPSLSPAMLRALVSPEEE